MKQNRILISFAVIAILSLALSLAACAPKPAETEPEPDHANPTTLEIPSDAEIEAAYKKASEAYSWFDMTTLPTTQDKAEVEEMTYYKVDYPGITTMAELEAYLKTIFTDEVAAELMALNQSDKYWHYDDIDGALYALPGARGADIFKGEESYEVIVKGGDEIDFRVSVPVYDDPATMNVVSTEVYDFMYVDPAGSGEWRFANFESVR